MYKYLFSVALFAVTPVVSAQDASSVDPVFAPDPEDAITITVTGSRADVEDAGEAVTVIAEAEIEAVQGADITRVLRRAPGVTFSRNGGPGAFTATRVRGAPGEQTLVLIDGVRVSDPAAPGGGFDFGNLLATNIAKLDLLRGSNSTIWGSDAIGGVLAVTTDTQSGLEASVEYGARDTATASVAGGAGGDAGFVGLSASWFDTDGFSAAAAGTEADGFEQVALNGQGRLYLSDRFDVVARARYAEGHLELDGFPAPSFQLADTDEFQETEQYSASIAGTYDSGALLLVGSYSVADTERANFNRANGLAPGFTSDGHRDRLELRGEWRAIGPVLVNFGVEQDWTSLETLFTPRVTTDTTAAYVQGGIDYGPLSARIGVRHDDERRFGGATSFGADASYEIAPDLRVRASVGEGFKAPTLFQLLSDFGNPSLDPERATSFDFGLAYGTRAGEGAYASATLFRRDSEGLIDFVSCFGVTGGICEDRPFGTFDNVERARAQGVEVEAGIVDADGLAARLAYAFIDTEDRTPGAPTRGNRLARQPRHAGTLSVDYALGALLLGSDLRVVSNAFDDATNSVRLDGYALLDLRAELALSEFRLFGRIENAWDEDYQTAAGFGSPGRGVFVGIRAEL